MTEQIHFSIQTDLDLQINSPMRVRLGEMEGIGQVYKALGEGGFLVMADLQKTMQDLPLVVGRRVEGGVIFEVQE